MFIATITVTFEKKSRQSVRASFLIKNFKNRLWLRPENPEKTYKLRTSVQYLTRYTNA